MCISIYTYIHFIMHHLALSFPLPYPLFPLSFALQRLTCNFRFVYRKHAVPLLRFYTSFSSFSLFLNVCFFSLLVTRTLNLCMYVYTHVCVCCVCEEKKLSGVATSESRLWFLFFFKRARFGVFFFFFPLFFKRDIKI